MQLRSRTGIGVTFIELEGHIDTRSAPEFEQALRPLLESAEPRLLLDFSRVGYISSAGIRVLLSALKTAKTQRGEIRSIGVGQSVKEIFDIVGLAQHMGIFEGRSAALANLGLDVTERTEQGLRILRLEGNLDKSAGGILKTWLQRLQAEPGAACLIDLSAVNYAAIECLRLLQAGSAEFTRHGRALIFLTPQQAVWEAIEVCGLSRDLRLAKNLAEALTFIR